MVFSHPKPDAAVKKLLCASWAGPSHEPRGGFMKEQLEENIEEFLIGQSGKFYLEIKIHHCPTIMISQKYRNTLQVHVTIHITHLKSLT